MPRGDYRRADVRPPQKAFEQSGNVRRTAEKEVYDAVMALQRHTGAPVTAWAPRVLRNPSRAGGPNPRVTRFADKPVLLAPAEDPGEEAAPPAPAAGGPPDPDEPGVPPPVDQDSGSEEERAENE